MSEPKFKRGDVVKHRASGETAVIVYPLMKCTNPNHRHTQTHLRLIGPTEDCIFEFANAYRLDTGFTREDIEYPEDLLEA